MENARTQAMRQPGVSEPLPTITLCMIVKDEERCLARCLASAREWVDEIVVVDTGSGDSTVDIALEFGARVLHHRWRDDFAAARNLGLEAAQSDWILVLDADEEIEQGCGAALRDAVANTSADALQLIRRNQHSPGELTRYGVESLVRVFRNRPEYRYHQPIHEQVLPAIQEGGGMVEPAHQVTLSHDGYLGASGHAGESKALRNLGIVERLVKAAPHDPYYLFHKGMSLVSLGRWDAAYQALEKMVNMPASKDLSDMVQCTAHMKLGQIALQQKAYAQGAAWALSSLSWDPDRTPAQHVLGICCLYLGHYEDAAIWLDKVRHSPMVDPAHHADLDGLVGFARAQAKQG